MKDRNFRFRQSFADVIKDLDDKQTGQYVRSIAEYAFEDKTYAGKDIAVKTAFTLTKEMIDEERFYRDKGRLGAKKNAEMRRAKQDEPSIAKVIAGGIVAGEMLKSILESQNEQLDEDDEPTENKFEKGGF